MCGIVGYVGGKKAAPILISGLKRLEYRGYDSAGITVYDDNCLKTMKCKGRVAALEKMAEEADPQGFIGIGHTRWATHGEPSDLNSHPHCSSNGGVCVVHNGIFENYQEIKNMLAEKGYSFVSGTDTEVIANLIDYCYHDCKSLTAAVGLAISKMEGSNALGVMSGYEPDKVVAVKTGSPLLAGVAPGEGFIASDVSALLPYTRTVYYLNDGEMAVISRGGVTFLSKDGKALEKEPVTITWTVDDAEKGGYEHFMLKEIFEQPRVLKDSMAGRVAAGRPVAVDGLNMTAEEISAIKKIFVVACGTASYAGLVGKYLMERLCRIPTEADVASEFRYRDPIVPENTLFIAISQSGETADTLAAMREARVRGAKILAVTNVMGSTIAREADAVYYIQAGPEICVAATKSYTAQIMAMATISLYFAQCLESLPEAEINRLTGEMLLLPEKAEALLSQRDTIQKFASETYCHRDMYYLGRGLDTATALEGALKLKEISYIHADSYAGGELKHGPIALIEPGTVVVALATQNALISKMVGNIKEVTARGARVLCFTAAGYEAAFADSAQAVFAIPPVDPLLAPVLAAIPVQLFAYYVAVLRGCDVDKPRNLAKSVTVE